MPIYAYGCGKCGEEADAFRAVDARHDGPMCCGSAMNLEIRPTYVRGDISGYVSPASGKWIEGRRARRDDLARSGCRPWEGMVQEKAEAARQKAYSDKKIDSELHDATSKAFHQLSPSKKRVLGG